MKRSDQAALPRREDGALAELILACPMGDAGDEPQLLRQGYAAIIGAAAVDPGLAQGLPCSAEFEALLRSGGTESAAMALIPSRAGFMLSRGEHGNHIGSIYMLECGEHTAECGTAALALLAATLSACGAVIGQQGRGSRLLN